MGSKHAVVVSYLALFIALGGTATALQGRYSVQADDLATGSVGRRALHPRTITPGKMTANAVGPRNIRRGAIGPAHLRTNSVGPRALAQRSVGRFTLQPGAVDERALQDGAVTSDALAPQTEVSFGSDGEIQRKDFGLRVRTQHLEWAPIDSGVAPVVFSSSPTGGGGLILNSSPGPQSGYLRLTEGNGSPPSVDNAATLVARDNGSGKTELVVFWEGGVEQILATEP